MDTNTRVVSRGTLVSTIKLRIIKTIQIKPFTNQSSSETGGISDKDGDNGKIDTGELLERG